MSTDYTVPEPAAAVEEVLPEFNNGVTPRPAPPPPVITEPVPILPLDPSVAPVPSDQHVIPVEAVPGVGVKPVNPD